MRSVNRGSEGTVSPVQVLQMFSYVTPGHFLFNIFHRKFLISYNLQRTMEKFNISLLHCPILPTQFWFKFSCGTGNEGNTTRYIGEAVVNKMKKDI